MAETSSAGARPRELLSRDHQRLEGLFERLLAAFDAGDAATTQSLWSDLERGINAHFRFEEADLFPRFEAVSRPEVDALRAEHDAIRKSLARLGVEVDLHLVTPATARGLIDGLRAHAKREDALMYAWADSHVDEGVWARIRQLVAG
jgi:hemerythrin-like domain-containing protein